MDNSQRQVTKDQTARLLEVLALGKPVIVTLHVPIMTEDNREQLARGREVMVGFDRKVPVTNGFLEEIRACDIREKDFLDYAEDLLVIHGTTDEIIPYAESFAFADHGALKTIVVPEGVTTIRMAAFIHATALQELHLPSSAVDLGRGPDDGTGQICGNTTIIAPQGSAAQQYAEQFNLAFEAAQTAENTTTVE